MNITAINMWTLIIVSWLMLLFDIAAKNFWFAAGVTSCCICLWIMSELNDPTP